LHCTICSSEKISPVGAYLSIVFASDLFWSFHSQTNGHIIHILLGILVVAIPGICLVVYQEKILSLLAGEVPFLA
jgi:hypothetical protein